MPFIVTPTKLSPTSYAFSGIGIISSGGMSGLTANVTFTLLDQNNSPVGSKTISFSGTQYNDFWNNFSTGTYVYEQLANVLGAPPPPPNSLDSDFVNQASQ